MKYRLFGKSGLRVSEAALGTMTFGQERGWGAPKDESRKVYDAFREAGGNFIDTAYIYTDGTSESFLGEFLEASATAWCWPRNTPTQLPVMIRMLRAIIAKA